MQCMACSFLVRLWRALTFAIGRLILTYNEKYVELFSMEFPNMTIDYAVWEANRFVNTLSISAWLPNVIVGQKPKRDRKSMTAYAFFCNKTFRDLPQEERLAAYAHEVGHLWYRHFDNPDNIRDGVLVGTHLELMADEFACSLGHAFGLRRFLERARHRLQKLLDDDTVMDVLSLAEITFSINVLNQRIFAVQTWIDEEEGRGEEICVSTVS